MVPRIYGIQVIEIEKTTKTKDIGIYFK